MNKFPWLGSSNLHVEVLVGLFMTLSYLINIIFSCAKCFLGKIGRKTKSISRVSGQDQDAPRAGKSQTFKGQTSFSYMLRVEIRDGAARLWGLAWTGMDAIWAYVFKAFLVVFI